MVVPWYLKRADVTYRCIGCQASVKVVLELPDLACMVGGACAKCFNLMGIENVRYYTNDDELPEDTNVFTSDRKAAALLGIDLQPMKIGGSNESKDDDDLPRN